MLNMQFAQRVVIDTNALDWQPSPARGVWRKPLAREDAERGHATSIVRYDPGSSFARHTHPLGEEILVLDGVFSDEFGDFGAGTYFRNPPESGHAPFSEPGCVLLVKLHQFLPGDLAQVRIDTSRAQWMSGHDNEKVMPLHAFEAERVTLVRWPAGARGSAHRHAGGEEIFVLAGEWKDEHGAYPRGTWLRSPDSSTHRPYVEEETLLWVKTGHLPVGSTVAQAPAG